MDTPSLTSIILNNPLVLALGVGIGIAYAILYHYYHRLIKHESAGPISLNPAKDVFFTVVVLFSIVAADHLYSAFLSGLLGISLAPGDQVRLSEGIADRMYQDVKSTLYWSYLGEFVFSFFASMQFSFKIDMMPGFVSKPLKITKKVPALGKFVSRSIKTLLERIGGSAGKLFKGITGSADIGTLAILFQPMAGVAVLWQVMEKASMFLFFMVLGYFLFYTIITMIVPLSAIFLPLGLGMMFIPVIRRTGASIVAIVLTLYFVFPLVTIYMDGVFRNIFWYDSNRLFSFLSPTLVGFAYSDPSFESGDLKYSSFLMREKTYSYLKEAYQNVNLSINNTDLNALVRTIEYEQICTASDACVNIYGEEISPEEAEKGVYQDFRSQNVVAPWGSFLGKTATFLGEAWLLQKTSAFLTNTLLETFTGPVGIVYFLARIFYQFMVLLFVLATIFPVPPDSPLAAVAPTFLPFHFFKSTMIFLVYVAQYAIVYATLLFFQIFLMISAYRSISSILGGELSLPGLEKVL